MVGGSASEKQGGLSGLVWRISFFGNSRSANKMVYMTFIIKFLKNGRVGRRCQKRMNILIIETDIRME